MLVNCLITVFKEKRNVVSAVTAHEPDIALPFNHSNVKMIEKFFFKVKTMISLFYVNKYIYSYASADSSQKNSCNMFKSSECGFALHRTELIEPTANDFFICSLISSELQTCCLEFIHQLYKWYREFNVYNSQKIYLIHLTRNFF